VSAAITIHLCKPQLMGQSLRFHPNPNEPRGPHQIFSNRRHPSKPPEGPIPLPIIFRTSRSAGPLMAVIGPVANVLTSDPTTTDSAHTPDRIDSEPLLPDRARTDRAHDDRPTQPRWRSQSFDARMNFPAIVVGDLGSRLESALFDPLKSSSVGFVFGHRIQIEMLGPHERNMALERGRAPMGGAKRFPHSWPFPEAMGFFSLRAVQPIYGATRRPTHIGERPMRHDRGPAQRAFRWPGDEVGSGHDRPGASRTHRTGRPSHDEYRTLSARPLALIGPDRHTVTPRSNMSNPARSRTVSLFPHKIPLSMRLQTIP